MKKFHFYLGHPAHWHTFKNVIAYFKSKDYKVTISIKKKDILEDLLKENNVSYFNILPEGRSRSLLGIGNAVFKRDYRLYNFLKNKEYDLLIGADTCIAHVGRLLKKPSIIFCEDDYEVVPKFAKVTYPFCSYIISPEICNVGKWYKKKIGYQGYQKLAYLHPEKLKPSLSSIEKNSNDFDSPYTLIRLSGLSAYHDYAVRGFNNKILKEIIQKLELIGNVYISSEKELPEFYNRYMPAIAFKDIHHILANAQLLISDSQSMSIEASLLGTPSLRLSSFAGKISVLQELENKYKLTFGFHPNEKAKFINKLDELIKLDKIETIWEERRLKMLEEKINVNKFYCWLLENFPFSVDKLKAEPNFIDTFK